MLKDPELAAVLWHALERVAGKEGRRDHLTAGERYDLKLAITGEIAGQPIDAVRVAGILSVGHDSTRASSTGPKAELLLAHVLARLNERTREKICRELPEVFAREGNQLPAADPAIVAAATNLLARLRAKTEITARGPVSCPYTIALEA
ncbi:MAG: hypothetical protein JW809_14845 [Pirellulales bacterium]|nr:hypothetical protein [Pirellulales bacterium]